MRRKSFTFILLLAIVTFFPFSCQQNPTEYRNKANDPAFLHRSVKKVTDVIVHDIFSPPVASRIYVYASIAAYQALLNEHSDYRSLAGQLKGLDKLPAASPDLEYCFPLASVKALLTVGRALTFSEEKIESFEEEILKEYKKTGMPREVFNNSVAYGQQVADAVLAWAAKDNYKESRGFERYTVTNLPGTWVPTPPDYMDAIEPHWNTMRTFVLDSCNQFSPTERPMYSLEKNSKFYKELAEVYETTTNLTEEQKEIASFWDCNPFNIEHTGHFMFGKKKISPGGHWMGIAALTCRKANADFIQSAETYAMVSLALADGFISCWDEKYRSKLLRPETVINQHLDDKWEPLLTTPPFPEYPSGHSVISSAAAIALTDLYGDNFNFIDSTEMDYGLQPREFKSFLQASEEAAISRLYGGIHYRSAIDDGVVMGRKVGALLVQRIETRKKTLALEQANVTTSK
jgi:hypothetical protein